MRGGGAKMGAKATGRLRSRIKLRVRTREERVIGPGSISGSQLRLEPGASI